MAQSRTLWVAAVALVVAATLGYWAYGVKKRSDVGNTAVALAQATARHLEDAFVADPGRASTETAQAIGEYAAAASRNLETLRRLDASGKQPLVDAVDDFLLTGREILTRQAASYRFRRQLSQSAQALHNHMRADNRTGAWIREAVRHKEHVEKDYRDYVNTAEALDKLLQSFPASVAKVAARTRAAPLVDAKLVDQARSRSNAALKQATGEVERIRKLALPR